MSKIHLFNTKKIWARFVKEHITATEIALRLVFKFIMLEMRNFVHFFHSKEHTTPILFSKFCKE